MLIAIVDDSKNEQKLIYKAIAQWAKSNHQTVSIKLFDCGEDFLTTVPNTHYDIVFMDIYMKDMTGIDTAINLRQHHPDTLLIFFTTSAEHMAQAFPCHAFDYIIKPVDNERLYKTLDEAIKVLPENQLYLSFVFKHQEVSVLYSDIICILSDANYCKVCMKYNEYRTRASFNELTAPLNDSSMFFSIGRGIMVNLDNVLNLGENNCVMVNGKTLPVSRRKKSDVEHALLKHRFEIRRKGEIR